MKARIEAFERKLERKRETPSINITNNVHVTAGGQKAAHFTGRFYLGSVFYPGWQKGTTWPTISVPEIYIEHEDGKRE